MCRSLGLREDQAEGEALALRIAGLFPLEPLPPMRRPVGSRRQWVLLEAPVDVGWPAPAGATGTGAESMNPGAGRKR